MSKLKLPTDDEISEMVGGIPVTSFRHEDLPNLKPSIYEGFSSWEFSERIQDVQRRWLEFNPAIGKIDNFDDLARGTANTRSAQITTFSFSGSGKPDCFSLLRPSNSITESQKEANTFGLRNHQVKEPIPQSDNNFISTFHEIGYMDAYSRGLKSEGDYQDELYADKFALTKYLNAGGRPQVVRDYINCRALAGFLKQPYKYWLSQPLSNHFFGDIEGLPMLIDQSTENEDLHVMKGHW